MNEVKVYSGSTEDDNRRYAYEKAIEAYWKHVDRYHTWMNYYAIFNGALFVGFCTILTATTTIEPYIDGHIILSLSNNYIGLQIVLTIIGLISSSCWILSLVGHEAWENNWMNIIESFENENSRVYTSIITDDKKNFKLGDEDRIQFGNLKNGFSTHFTTKVFVFCIIIGWLFLMGYSINSLFENVDICNFIYVFIFFVVFVLFGFVFNHYCGFGTIYSNVIGKFYKKK